MFTQILLTSAIWSCKYQWREYPCWYLGFNEGLGYTQMSQPSFDRAKSRNSPFLSYGVLLWSYAPYLISNAFNVTPAVLWTVSNLRGLLSLIRRISCLHVYLAKIYILVRHIVAKRFGQVSFAIEIGVSLRLSLDVHFAAVFASRREKIFVFIIIFHRWLNQFLT